MRYGRSFPDRLSKFLFYIDGYLLLLSIIAIFSFIIENGFELNHTYRISLGAFHLLLGIIFVGDYFLKFLLAERKSHFIQRNPWYGIVTLLILLNIITVFSLKIGFQHGEFDLSSLVRPKEVLWMTFRLLVFVVALSKLVRIVKVVQGLGVKPVQLLCFSFFMLIVTGMLLLMVPEATTHRIRLIDAAFMATSATCVTGLATKSVGNDFTTFGQLILLTLIQIGGLGIMTLTAFVAVITRRGFSLTSKKIVSEITEIFSAAQLLPLIKQIVGYTLAMEFIGATILSVRWYQEFHNWGKAIYFGIFHAISAFCNAGFGLLDSSLESYIKDPFISLTIAFLIMGGSIGYLIVHDLFVYYRDWKHRHAKRLGVQTRITIIITLILLIGGTILIWIFEQPRTLAGYDPFTQWSAAFFQSVATRTAGFNTIHIPSLSQATLFIMIFLMFIGGSSGSTAGGIKTSTFGVLLAQVRATMFGDSEVIIFERTIPRSTITKAISITLVSTLLIFICLVIMLVTQPFPFLDSLFETISAFGTVGLSTGITPELNPIGKITIMTLMYLGRVGPVSFFVALGEIAHRERVVTYPESYIMVG